jgi:hypothetical protein
MRVVFAFGFLAAALALGGCGGTDEAEPEKEEAMRVEDTVFRDVVGAQDRARDGANAAVELHRETLERRVEEDEGAPPAE